MILCMRSDWTSQRNFRNWNESENLRLDKNTTEIKRILNKSEFLTEKEISYFRRFLKEISKDYIKEENTEMLAKEELQQFLELYAKENERVAEEYIGDGQRLFSNEVKDLPKWNPQNEKMQEELFSSLQQLLWISEERMKFSVRK